MTKQYTHANYTDDRIRRIRSADEARVEALQKLCAGLDPSSAKWRYEPASSIAPKKKSAAGASGVEG